MKYILRCVTALAAAFVVGCANAAVYQNHFVTHPWSTILSNEIWTLDGISTAQSIQAQIDGITFSSPTNGITASTATNIAAYQANQKIDMNQGNGTNISFRTAISDGVPKYMGLVSPTNNPDFVWAVSTTANTHGYATNDTIWTYGVNYGTNTGNRRTLGQGRVNWNIESGWINTFGQLQAEHYLSYCSPDGLTQVRPFGFTLRGSDGGATVAFADTLIDATFNVNQLSLQSLYGNLTGISWTCHPTNAVATETVWGQITTKSNVSNNGGFVASQGGTFLWSSGNDLKYVTANVANDGSYFQLNGNGGGFPFNVNFADTFIWGNLTATNIETHGDASIMGDLEVTGVGTIHQSLTVDTNVSVGGFVGAGRGWFTNQVNMLGASNYVAGNLSVKTNLYTDKIIPSSGTLNIGPLTDAYIWGSLTSSNLETHGDASIMGDLEVTGVGTIHKSLTVDTNLSVGGTNFVNHLVITNDMVFAGQRRTNIMVYVPGSNMTASTNATTGVVTLSSSGGGGGGGGFPLTNDVRLGDTYSIYVGGASTITATNDNITNVFAVGQNSFITENGAWVQERNASTAGVQTEVTGLLGGSWLKFTSTNSGGATVGTTTITGTNIATTGSITGDTFNVTNVVAQNIYGNFLNATNVNATNVVGVLTNGNRLGVGYLALSQSTNITISASGSPLYLNTADVNTPNGMLSWNGTTCQVTNLAAGFLTVEVDVLVNSLGSAGTVQMNFNINGTIKHYTYIKQSVAADMTIIPMHISTTWPVAVNDVVSVTFDGSTFTEFGDGKSASARFILRP